MTQSLICIGGMSGTGKSTLARNLHAQMPNSVHIDSDVLRKELWGVGLTDKLPDEAYGTKYYSSFFKAINTRIKEHLAAGKTVILSATYATPRWRTHHEKLAALHDATFTGLWLQASDFGAIFDRVAQRSELRNDASDITVDKVQKLQKDIMNVKTGWPVLDANTKQKALAKAALEVIEGSKAKHLYGIEIESAPTTGSVTDFIEQQTKLTRSAKRAIRNIIKNKGLSDQFNTVNSRVSDLERNIVVIATETAVAELRQARNVNKIRMLRETY